MNLTGEEALKGLTDADGGVIIPAGLYDDISEDHRGKIVVYEVAKGDKHGILSSDGKVIVPCEYDLVHSTYHVFVPQKDGKFGIIDFEGNRLAPDIYDTVYMITNSDKYIPVELNGKWGIIDLSGKITVPVIYDNLGIDWHSDLRLVPVRLNGKWGVVDENGNTIAPFIYSATHGYENGFIGMKKGGLWGYLNEQGEVAIPFMYEDASSFGEMVNCFTSVNNDRARVKLGGKCGEIDKDNNIVTPLEHDELWWDYESEN